jgi:hypothetical protein
MIDVRPAKRPYPAVSVNMHPTDLAPVSDSTPVSMIRSRPIGESDVPAIASLLAKGFQSRPPRFWSQVFAFLRERPVPAGLPKYGYLLEAEGAAVGAILLIFSTVPGSDGTRIRCNVSSWFVEPGCRGYASLLVCKAMSRQNVTYLNITPAPHTLSILQAQGYSQYSGGVFVTAPFLQIRCQRSHVREIKVGARQPRDIESFEYELLVDHARYGCMSLSCETADRAYPFVFRPRVHKGIACAQLVYCRNLEDLVRFAGPIGRFLLARGWPLVVIDANDRIPGLVGRYFNGRMPKYFKGPDRPRLGDLAYTETAMFGM